MTDAETIHDAVAQTADNGVQSVFRDFDATDINSNVYEFPVVDADMPAPVTKEGAELPRDQADVDTETVRFEKYGFEVTDETDADELQDIARLYHASIAGRAVDAIYEATDVSLTTVGSRTDIIERALFAPSRGTMFTDETVVVVPAVLGESIAEAYEDQEWDEVRADLEDKYECTIRTDQFNVLRGGDVLVVDPNTYGYEAVRTEETTQSYVDEGGEDATEVTRFYSRRGFVVLNDEVGQIVRIANV